MGRCCSLRSLSSWRGSKLQQSPCFSTVFLPYARRSTSCSSATVLSSESLWSMFAPKTRLLMVFCSLPAAQLMLRKSGVTASRFCSNVVRPRAKARTRAGYFSRSISQKIFNNESSGWMQPCSLRGSGALRMFRTEGLWTTNRQPRFTTQSGGVHTPFSS